MAETQTTCRFLIVNDEDINKIVDNAIHWKNIYKSYHENIMFFREKIINCFLKIIIIMIFFLPIFRLVKKS